MTTAQSEANSPSITFTHDAAINYAFQQNAIPVIKELRLANDGSPRKNLTLKIYSDPGFAIPTEIRVQSIAAGGEFRPSIIDLKLSPDFLSALNEKVAGCIKVEVIEDEKILCSTTNNVSLLARNEWAGIDSLPEIIAAFILPNDPAVMQILDKASTLLQEATGRSALNGYQDKSRSRAWEQVSAIYAAIETFGIRYINPPASFETTGQKVRFPSEILTQRFGTCLDLSLLFCACCEQVGLRPMLLMHQGHAYAGCWLEEKCMETPVCDELRLVRILEELESLTVVETTLLTSDTPVGLKEAEREGKRHLTTSLPFRAAIDIHATRLARIHPLPIEGTVIQVPGASGRRSESASDGIGHRQFNENAIEQTAKTKAATRIDLWKTRLLDLSLRNRLLNFKETKSTVRILSNAAEHVEDELASERELALLPKPKLMSEKDPRNAALYSKQQKADVLTVHLTDSLKLARLHTDHDDADHSGRLTDLYRASKTAAEENGTNTLYAAVGILEWKETEHSEKLLRAPILLVPVELKRKSVVEGFTLRRIDEETRINVTLLEMLRQSFQKEIPGLDPLPEDSSGVDVGLVLNIFRKAVLQMKGWEVKSEIWLGQFSFTKFLLWKDLEDRLETLTSNRIVDHLVNSAGHPYPNSGDEIKPSDLDAKYHPREIFCPRSADSSQLAAVMAAAAGQDFILEGPPGTGKSQTITNIIAHCLAEGKRVLFVAEKRAALDVVHRRLKEDGLDSFCLELHSNKVGKTDVLQQFDKTLKLARDISEDDWNTRTEAVAKARDQLNDYTQALHKRFPCGLSAYHCMDYALPRKVIPTARWSTWPGLLDMEAAKLEQMRAVSRLIQERLKHVAPVCENPLRQIGFSEWSPAWAEKSYEHLQSVRTSTRNAVTSKDELSAWMGVSGDVSREKLTRLSEFAETLLSPEPVGAAFVTSPWKPLSEKIGEWARLSDERASLRNSLRERQDSDATSPACERWTDTHAASISKSGRELLALTDQLAPLANAYADWISAPRDRLSRDGLASFDRLAESLLAPLPVAAPFLTTRWEEFVSFLDSWIKLVEERILLREKLTGYDETVLLATMDLDELDGKWKSAQNAWFVIKWLRIGHVRRKLKLARPDRVKPDATTIGVILTDAIRLKQINSTLDAAHQNAVVLLGEVWGGGNPPADALKSARTWGQSVHERIRECADLAHVDQDHLKKVIAGHFVTSAVSLSPGTKTGDMLQNYRSRFAAYQDTYQYFVAEAATRREQLDRHPSHLDATSRFVSAFLKEFVRVREINASLQFDTLEARAALSSLWNSGEPSAESLRRAQQWGDKFHSRMLKCAEDDFSWLGTTRHLLSAMFAEGVESFEQGTKIGQRLRNFVDANAAQAVAYKTFADCVTLHPAALAGATDYLKSVGALADKLAESWSKIRYWCAWQKVRDESFSLNLDPVISLIESPGTSVNGIEEIFELSFRNAFLLTILEKEPILRDFFGSEHSERIIHFRDIDAKHAELTRAVIRRRLEAEIPSSHFEPEYPKAEIGLLLKEIGKKTRHIPVRQLLSKIPKLMPRLKPCLLMSPLSVAQYLDADHTVFDVVIFDEASQIPVWDAVGAIARGKQLIVVGDPKQLPPTDFFSNGNADDGDGDGLVPNAQKDLESILDELLSNGLRHKRLKWHYRSRHEGLITFSNRQYYENELLTFPSPESNAGGVRFVHLPEARYDKGKSRTNKGEATALVDELVKRLREPKGKVFSYGIVTFSRAQQDLIENLLDEKRRQYPEIEVHFGENPPMEGEPVFIKNLENVQGDERDVIFFSIGYGPDEAGKVSMNFGPLNRDGGERRLNVAITRAKHEVVVFSGLRGDQIDLTRTNARGVRDLKLFLDYADQGPKALVAASQAHGDAEPDSEFEHMVAKRIREAGFDIHHQVGCSGYRIDLAVVDPLAPGRYLLGIECDGATYHRAATARDRDKLRQQVLEGLGWSLHRIWSTDWWHDADSQIDRLISAIEAKRVMSRN